MADGDLDGDGKGEMSHRHFLFVIYRLFSDPVVGLLYLTDYFVMWNEKIIHHLTYSVDEFTLKARRELSKLELPPAEGKSVDRETKFAKSSDNNWLSKAQDNML